MQKIKQRVSWEKMLTYKIARLIYAPQWGEQLKKINDAGEN